MRSHKLTSAVMAAAAVLALATAGSAAARKPHHIAARHGVHAGVCRVSLNVAPRLVTTGESALAYGQGTCAAGTNAGQTVTLYERAAGSPGFSVVGTTTTDEHGFYQLATGALTSNTSFYTAIGTSRSHERSVRVVAVVSLTGPPETKTLFAGIHTGRRNAVTFSGTVSPDDAGATVVLQRENAIRGNEWHRISRPVLVDTSGNFSVTHAFVVPGASSIRVLVRSNHRNIASPSNVLSYAISQSENPSLTIESSQDPLAFGASAVIGGNVPGEPNTTLTLMGRVAHGAYAPVATTKTDPTGKYSFPAVAPPTSTFYKVQGGGRNSSVLYEGVKYILTAAASATSVQSGQPLAFTGTVTPAKAGHTIYLERQNAAGTGFHPIAIGTVSADGSYSITRTLFAPGSYTLRVKIPGDSENGGSVSQLFGTTVTPIPSSQIPTEAPGNGTLPPEGQV
ncbi:MAG TPA: hypothetical protein VH061_05750 [Solirubrobacteraceae bacterium]|jgi:hypothetical protein|nr:hypothetical protein [Solirubrobacteraceae bacterium]